MNLRTYLFENRISVTAFSKTLGCSRIHLSEIINGRRTPSLLLATSIEKMTESQVTVQELLKSKK